MLAYDLAIQNFSVAEHLLQLHELFRGLREEATDESLRLAVCRTMSIPEKTVLRHARNEQLCLVAKATAPIPQSLLVADGLNFLLRQAVVVACTALESFFWDALRENVLTIVRARRRRADDSLKSITLTIDDYRDYYTSIGYAVSITLSFRVIDEDALCLGMAILFGEAYCR